MDVDENAYCRLCADLKHCSDLTNLDLEFNAAKRREIVNKLLRFHIPVDFNNTLPKTVCFKCVKSLETAFDFVTTVEQAQEAFNTEYTLFFEERKAELYSDGRRKVSSDEDNSANKSSLDGSDETDTESENSKPKKGSHASSLTKRRGQEKTKKLKLKGDKEQWSAVTWFCGYCNALCSTVDRLKIHLMQFHSICNVFTCIECKEKEFSIDKFISHICKHQPFLTLTCHKCNKKCSSQKEMKRHKLTHLSSENFCCGCNTSFSSPEELEAHVNTYYKNKREENSLPIINNLSLVCVICQKVMKDKRLLSRHLHTHTERERNHTCDVCGKSFYLKRILERHSVVHSDERPYKCEICKFAYKLESALRNHVALHFKPKSFKCNKCGRCFRQQKELARHHIIHTNLRPFICAYCKKGFQFPHLLKQHIRLHTGLKPYSCDVCSKNFTNWPNYNKHMKEKHGINKANRKKTKDGLYSLDSASGKVIYPDKKKMMAWKNKILKTQKKGRPKKIDNS